MDQNRFLGFRKRQYGKIRIRTLPAHYGRAKCGKVYNITIYMISQTRCECNTRQENNAVFQRRFQQKNAFPANFRRAEYFSLMMSIFPIGVKQTHIKASFTIHALKSLLAA